MKSTNDLFEQQVRNFTKATKFPAPASTNDAVFNELDSAKSGSFASKSLLITVSVLTVGAIYMISNQPSQTEGVEPSTQIEQVVAAPEVLIEETAIEEVVEIVEVKKPITTEQVLDSEVFQEFVIHEEAVVAEEPEVDVEEIQEVAHPVKLVETETPVVKEQEVEEKKEEVEWVLPAKIKVEK